ncbi:transcription repressor OFP12-like [Cynara cardunculus var. scolymus]|uniref:Transcription repressor n=1 Tax=Cynara cardunculus var. scolymus TaxID=59895 RepID=A0A103Y7K4_CYNCS|nr:transcription repressor OFP12-like [Cynara cardunculus var. scolymus]KVI03981.1 Ovate protein family, C-terminal [Cynara cardunculus var. scolymus]
MPTTFERNLTLCFNKIKRLQSSPSPPPPRHHHRRHHSESILHNPKSNLIKNFNTLYDIPPAYDSDDASKTTATIANASAAADFSSVIASNRFFFSSPGRSNSIIESSSPSTSSLASTSSTLEIPPEDVTDGFVGGGVAIPTISPDPYFDFRKSMQEMVEARDLIDVRANWDYLHELLTCYLDLNPKSAHKFIVGAFADLLVTLMASSAAEGGGCRNL